ncbi:MAG: iron chelate uptake ABC transporter family permease subunit [Prevotella sp.]
MKRYYLLLILLLIAFTIVLLAANLLIGTVRIPLKAMLGLIGGIPSLLTDYSDHDLTIWKNIIVSSRMPQTVTSMLAGAGLAVSGLQMQTVFHNPLAGPSVLGVSNGASLGVAFVVLLSSSLGGVALSRLGYVGDVAVTIVAIIGALTVLALIIAVAQYVSGNVTLLLIGVMIGYLANAIIGVLKFFSPEEDVKAYVVWGLGCFSRTSGTQLLVFTMLMCILLPLSMLLIKTMNVLLLGDNYARNLGLDIRRSRIAVIISSGLLAAVVTAYCGPIMFIGLAVPHLAQALFRTSDHRLLMPSTLVTGAALALVCNILARLPGFEGALPVNSVTALVGAPIIAMVLLRKR